VGWNNLSSIKWTSVIVIIVSIFAVVQVTQVVHAQMPSYVTIKPIANVFVTYPNELSQFFFAYVLPFLGGFGVISFGWNIYSYKKEQAGFLTPKLECSSKSNADEKYVLSKTLLENTSRTYRIMVVHAFLLIVDQSVSYKDGIKLVTDYVSENVCFLQLKMYGRMFQHLADMAMVMESVFRSSKTFFKSTSTFPCLESPLPWRSSRIEYLVVIWSSFHVYSYVSTVTCIVYLTHNSC
jgi:hypothetical protein